MYTCHINRYDFIKKYYWYLETQRQVLSYVQFPKSIKKNVKKNICFIFGISWKIGKKLNIIIILCVKWV